MLYWVSTGLSASRKVEYEVSIGNRRFFVAFFYTPHHWTRKTLAGQIAALVDQIATQADKRGRQIQMFGILQIFLRELTA